ncbi:MULTISPECIES: MATE family efflux transporter [Methanosarcina]|uniref:Multidrug export protein MepA n=4 Tax=Methanosarcina barkeri TaxID=2208 RepID=A0A0E3QTC6_METBA|nr:MULTISPECIES: MATE family efflux transporter [Methanosarcina]AKB54595.1 Multi antimicrobial extrusion protein (Na(+)/drug antiporter), MATE family of MDR efflux pumps [Methanosarcina barkeri MS]AKB57326.1 Multi antimicrobial extrusion protein (Na(+)/drug antiporter), MATE family of MDR efflux pumps [Methanosarcina barkeri 227]AKJ37881.1 MatE efflux family protein [Methanosarcina barkeri CM1]OED03812.1 MATE family efflux transporter [Methanosarcina sp. A14]
MTDESEMRSASLGKLFLKFVFPATIGLIVAGIQGVIDGFFIGNSVGSQGLAGVTLAFPALLAIIAVGQMIGIGTSSLVALALGRANRQEALRLINNAFPMLLFVGIGLTSIGLAFSESYLHLLGASGPVFSMANSYLRVLFSGSILLILSIALEPLVRNDGKPRLAMTCVVASVLVNMVLDYLFVMRMEMGVTGAAIATVIAFSLSGILLALYFFSGWAGLKLNPRSLSLEPKIIIRIMRTGFPSFAMQFSTFVLLFANEYMLLSYGSELAVSGYGIIGYVFSIFSLIFEGIAVGTQPIIGFNYGARCYSRVAGTLKIAVISCLVAGLIGFMLLSMYPEQFILIFNRDSPKLLEITLNGMEIFVFALLTHGTVMLGSVYFQSINKIRYALFIQLGTVFLFLLPLLWILPPLLDLNGVWLATPAAEFLMFLVVLGLLWKEFGFLKNGIAVSE